MDTHSKDNTSMTKVGMTKTQAGLEMLGNAKMTAAQEKMKETIKDSHLESPKRANSMENPFFEEPRNSTFLWWKPLPLREFNSPERELVSCFALCGFFIIATIIGLV